MARLGLEGAQQVAAVDEKGAGDGLQGEFLRAVGVDVILGGLGQFFAAGTFLGLGLHLQGSSLHNG